MRVLEAAPPLLRVQGLVKRFPLEHPWFRAPKRWMTAVDGIDLELRRGETLALVGESGCGKTTAGRAILQLYPPTAGQVLLDGEDLAAAPGPRRRTLLRRIQAVFQDPTGSLDPRQRIGASIAEPLVVQGETGRSDLRERVRQLLVDVGLSPDMAVRFPHQLSGGQRQRVGIARAMALGPDIVIADEPTSALDVSVRVQILNLLAELQQRAGVSFLLISHDLGAVRHYSHRIAVMYQGRIVEEAPTLELLANPLHPYTQILLRSVPSPDPRRRKSVKENTFAGRETNDEVGSASIDSGCAFASRCPLVEARCRTVSPQLVSIASSHKVACHVTGAQVGSGE